MIGFKELNPMQQQAVLQKDGPVLILAGAGSGKTGALTVRIAHLLEEGVRPFNILAITFTNKAAKEMKSRVEKLVGDQAGNIWISTFHSTCVRILRQEIHALGYDKHFSIYDADDQERMVKEAFRRLNFSLTDKNYPVKSAMSAISKAKEEMISWEAFAQNVDKDDIRSEKNAKVYQVYQELLKNSNALDFDDLIYKTVLLFRQFPEVLEKYQERFRYIMVDEYQDTNTTQYELICALAKKYKNLCVVGDDDQSIYGWRGANIRNILDFEKDFPETTVIKLEQNYRSTKKILRAANSVIHNNLTRKDKTLWTENEDGSQIHMYKSDSEYDEARFVGDRMINLQKEGHPYNDFAILYRTNAQSRVIEEQLIRKNIPYRLLSGTKFYDRKEIIDILSYLKVLANNRNIIPLKRIINVPKRGIGETSIERVNTFASEQDIGFYDALGRLDEIPELKTRARKFQDFYDLIESLKADVEKFPLVELIDAVVKRSGYLQTLLDEGTEDALSRIENINALINKAAEYEKILPEGGLIGFLEEVALVADVDGYQEDEPVVTLMTVHSSKGLEFPIVFLIGLEEGVFPSFRSVVYGGEKEIEEERRLCYVGITRAKEILFLIYARSRMQHGMTQYNQISRFLKEIPEELLEIPKRIATGLAQEYAKKNSMKIPSMTAKRPTPYGLGNDKKKMPTTIAFVLDFKEGDKVRAPKYGIGTVSAIQSGGADYEVEVSFGEKGVKKFMAKLSKLKKISED